MVLAGKVNKDLVALLSRHGGKALGLCGMDGRMMEVEKKRSDVDLGFVGSITKVNTQVILDALDNGYIPVISTVAADERGQVYNINADTAAAKIASELKAKNLILMTDIRGLLRDKDDESTLIPQVQVSEVPNLIRQGHDPQNRMLCGVHPPGREKVLDFGWADSPLPAHRNVYR